MRCHNLLEWEPCDCLKAVDVLGVAAQQQPFVVQQLDETVCWGRFVFPCGDTLSPHLFCQHVECRGTVLEEVDVEDDLRVWQVVLLQVVVKACSGGAEVWYSCRDTDACSGHYNDVT